MQVKIGSLWYRAEPGQPIMIYLEPQDRRNIENMPPEATRYACFHDDEPMSREEMWEWVGDRRPPVPQAYYENLVDELSEHAKNTLVNAGLSCGDHADPDDHDQGVMECLMGLMLGGVLDANQLLLQCEGADRGEADPESSRRDDCLLEVESSPESAQPQQVQTTPDYDSGPGASVVVDTQRYRVTSYQQGTIGEVLRKSDQYSVLMSGEHATVLWGALRRSHSYVDDDVVCERFDPVMAYNEVAAARYRRDERRRARKICEDAGIDVRVVGPEGWGG